jgi:hypothetical protein
MTLQKRAYTAGHFELKIDSHVTTAYIKTVEGGYARRSIVDEPIGPDLNRIKHTAVLDIEPMTCECGIAGLGDVLRWIQASWRKEFNRRSGQITHANFDLNPTFEHEFFDALIQETTFPALDGGAREAAFMKIKFQPERVKHRKVSSKNKVRPITGSKQKLWTPSSFRFSIDGIDEMKFTNKVDAFTVKQGVKKFWMGEPDHPQIEPTKLEFPNITGTIALEYADKLLEWYASYIVKGQNDKKAQKSGMIEFLDPSKTKTIFAINLYEMGIAHLQVIGSTANQDAIKRVKFELYCGRMDIDGGQQLGLE